MNATIIDKIAMKIKITTNLWDILIDRADTSITIFINVWTNEAINIIIVWIIRVNEIYSNAHRCN